MAITVYSGTVAENASNSTTLNVPYPTTAPGGILSTDILVLAVFLSNFNPATTPPGFTLLMESAAGAASPTTSARYKQAAGGETGNLSVTTPSTTSRGQLHVLRGVDLTSPIADTSTEIERAAGNTNYNIPGQTMPATDCLLMYGAASNTTSGTFSTPSVPAAFTELWDDTSPSPHSAHGYLLWSGSGATGTVNLTRSSSIRGAAWLISFRPAAAGTQYAATGTVAATGATTGTVALRAAVAGTVAAVTAVTGAVTSARPVTGTTAASSATSGAVAARLAASGTIAVTSATSGAPTSLLPTTGTVEATSATTGTIGKLYAAEGTTDATSDTAGDVTALLPTVGSTDATSETAGTPTARMGVTGTTAAVSGTSGSASIIGGPQQYPATGTVAASSTTLGDVRALLAAAGLVEATSDTGGSPTAVYVVGGTVEAVSGTSGDAEIGTEEPPTTPHVVTATADPARHSAATGAARHVAVTDPARYSASANRPALISEDT